VNVSFNLLDFYSFEELCCAKKHLLQATEGIIYIYMFIHQKVADIKERKRQTTCIQKRAREKYKTVLHNAAIPTEITQNII